MTDVCEFVYEERERENRLAYISDDWVIYEPI